MVLILFSTSCGGNKKDYTLLPTYSKTGKLQAVIEIPAGTNTKIEFNKDSLNFVPDRIDGQKRMIDFLSYPGNYGFIPSTYADPAEGGDGDAIDVLVLGSSLETASVIEVTAIGVLKLKDAGEEDYKIIAMPEIEGRILKSKDFKEFNDKYPGAKNIIETWFANYNQEDISEVMGWGDEKEASEYIEANRIKNKSK